MKIRSCVRSFVGVLGLAAAVGAAGCASAAEPPPPEEATAASRQAFSDTSNCQDQGNRSFTCSNLYPERVWNIGAYELVHSLSAWNDEQVAIKNTSASTIGLVSAQGINQWGHVIELAPGASTVLTRIDDIAPFYTTLLLVGDAPKGEISLEARVIRPPAPKP